LNSYNFLNSREHRFHYFRTVHQSNQFETFLLVMVSVQMAVKYFQLLKALYYSYTLANFDDYY